MEFRKYEARLRAGLGMDIDVHRGLDENMMILPGTGVFSLQQLFLLVVGAHIFVTIYLYYCRPC
jgi:hypothetical protein